ncbi:MAG: C40 family peptidase [Bacteroidales bacterium]|nr:C40 family peptidase [Candidatus Colimorpha onthohippi]
MKIKYALIAVTIAAFGMTGCDTVKNFLATDLEEEDFTVGQLYEDELVPEPVYVPPTVKVTDPNKAIFSTFEAARKGGKDAKLYAAIEPWMGVPYKYGGTDKNGVDCSAFVGHIFQDTYHIRLHRTANDIQKDVTPIKISELQEGDIIFFTNSKNKVSHVGIYLHDGMFVHASTSNGVSISTINNKYWSKHIYRGGRVAR